MKDIFTKITNKYIKKLSILLILIITSSCQDYACHEADDYGQYQTETLTIKPFSESASCEIDTSDVENLNIENLNTENEKLRKCIAVGPTTEYGKILYNKLQQETAIENIAGCLSEESSEDKKDCIESCKSKCKELKITDKTYDSEPLWKATTQKSANMNYGVRISPGSEIYIKASGEVYFGPTDKATSMYNVLPSNDHSHLLINSNTDTQYNPSTDIYSILFAGRIEEKIKTDESNTVTSSRQDDFDTHDEKIEDAAKEILHLGKKILIHYDYFPDISKTVECAEDSCKFNTQEIPSSELDSTQYIGMIKKKNSCKNIITDILDNKEYSPSTLDEICPVDILNEIKPKEVVFSECSDSKCDIHPKFNTIFSIINPDGGTIRNNSQKHIQYKFFKISALQCATNELLFKIIDKEGNEVKDINGKTPDSETYPFKFNLTDSTYNNREGISNFNKYKLYLQELILPPGYRIQYKDTGCSNIAALKSPLIKFDINKSGYAKIKTAEISSCNFKARIINPAANFSHEYLLTDIGGIDNYIDPGYYEYAHADDPLYKNPDGAINKEFYIRKGQSILFFPNECKNLYMQIEKPLPAIMCLHNTNETTNIKNPNCHPDGSEGCMPTYAKCFEEGSDEYCPTCQKVITDGVKQDQFMYIQEGIENDCENEKTQCDKCDDKRVEASKADPELPVSQKICYDFESYKGSIQNITRFDQDLLNVVLQENTKYLYDLKKVSEFSNQDGYGVIKRITNYSKNLLRKYKIDDTEYYFAESMPISITNVNNKLLKSYIIPFSGQYSSFLDIDNEKNIVGNKIALIFKSKYSGLNGKYMKVKLCKEDQPGSCSSVATTEEEGENIVDFATEDIEAKSSTKYEINNNGRITRIKTADSNVDCEEMFDGAQYYCHTKDSGSDDSEFDKYRLIFKIYDPEELNCAIDGGESNDGITNKSGNCVSVYSDNSGEYKVNIKVKTADTDYSKIIGSVIEPIIKIIDGKEGEQGKVEKTYKALIEDPKYKMIVRISMIAMVTFFGISYLMGVSELNNKEIISRIFKIALIYLFIGSTGWTWFNNLIVTPFKNGTDQIAFLMASSFDNSPELIKAIADKNYGDKSVLFSSIDKTFTLIMSDVVMKKITALIFADFFGWIYCILVLYGMLLYIYAVANAVLIYLTAQIFLSILFTLGPIFILFTLFKQTQDMFDNWLSGIISFSLQQIFLLTTLAFFNILIYEIIKLVLNYRICFGPVWIIDIWIAKINLLNWWHVASVPPSLTAASNPGINVNTESFPSFFSVLLIWVVASIMGKFIELMSELAQQISGGISAVSLSSGVRQLGAQLKGLAKQAGSKAMDFEVPYLGSVNSNVQRLDKYLFDSGKLAKKERNNKRQQDKVKTSQVNQLKKAANKAEDQYKRDNALNLAKHNKADQLQMIKGARNEAIEKEGKKMDLTPDQINELKRFKGASYQGDHLMGLIANKAIHSVKGDTTSLNRLDRNAKISLNKSQISEALANEKDEDKRKEIRSAIAGSDLIVERTALESAKKDLNIFKNIKKNAKKGYEFGKKIPVIPGVQTDKNIVAGGIGMAIGAIAGVAETALRSPNAAIKAVTGVKPTKAVKSAATSVSDKFKDTKSNLESSIENYKDKDLTAKIFGTKASKLGNSAMDDFKDAMGSNRELIRSPNRRSLKKSLNKVKLTAQALHQRFKERDIDFAHTKAGRELINLREQEALEPKSRVSLASSGMIKIAGAALQAIKSPIDSALTIRSNESRIAIRELTENDSNSQTFSASEIRARVRYNRNNKIANRTDQLKNSKKKIEKQKKKLNKLPKIDEQSQKPDP